MNIHLLRSKELDSETYGNVLNLLKQVQGPLSFIRSESEPPETTPHIIHNESSFQRKQRPPNLVASPYQGDNIEPKSYDYPKFPLRTHSATWESLWNKCRTYRIERDIGDSEHVILLTDIRNEKNWFSAFDPHGKNHFVHTADWPYYFGLEVDIRFPIAYECMASVLHHYMFEDYLQIKRLVHQKPRGCVNDLCEDKGEIILKMRTGDICSNCMELIDGKVPLPFVNQTFEIFDGIRKSLQFRDRSVTLGKPSRLEIRGYTKKIFLKDLGDLEVRLNPKERSLYILFLNRVEGISLTNLDEHLSELSTLYSRFSNQSDQTTIEAALKRLTDPADNNINEVISRINRKFRAAVGGQLLSHYAITGDRGEVKSVMLDRSLMLDVE